MKNFDEIMSLNLWRIDSVLNECAVEEFFNNIDNSEHMIYTDEYNHLFLESRKQEVAKIFESYGLDLEEYLSTFREDIGDTDDYIDEMEFDTNFGRMYVSRYNIECVLVDELLNNQEVIDKLVNAENFMEEFANVCEKAEEITLDLIYDEVKQEMKEKRLKRRGLK